MSEATRWWSQRRLPRWYEKDQPWRQELAQAIVATGARSVLEYGCAVGRNLANIRSMDDGIEVTGVDVNAEAVRRGNDIFRLGLRHVEPDWLETVDDDAYDVAFTSSVIDHVPDPAPILTTLVRIAPTLLLLEPWTGEEGPVEGARNPYTWSWDYPRRLRELGCTVAIRRLPISSEFTGPHYRLYTARRR